jgi:hypothetical protein
MISREEAIVILSARSRILKNSKKTGKQRAAKALDMAIEAFSHERPKGRWVGEVIYTEIGEEHAMQECSHCGKVRIIDNFCPNCGADMRGEE